MRRVIALSLALLVTPVIALSCGSGASQLCNDICACEGCSDKEAEDCQDAAQELDEDVAKEECTAELDAVFACIQENAECEDEDDYELDADDCEDEFEDLIDCCDNDCDLGDFFG